MVKRKITPHDRINNTISIIDIILINNPDDSERIVNKHLDKIPNFTPIVRDSIISTQELNQWIDLRKTLTSSFLPINLKQLFNYLNY